MIYNQIILTEISRLVGKINGALSAYLFAELAADVAKAFTAVEARRLQSTVAEHLGHLGVLC